MKQEEFTTLLSTLGLPVAYDHQKKGTPVPFINYTWNVNSALIADNKVYTKRNEVTLELVCSSKTDLNLWSEKLEELLEDVGPWIADEDRNDEEQEYIKFYTMEV